MAWDIFRRTSTGNDFARGEPPPAHSVEWAGIPQSAADMMARDRGKSKPAPAQAKKTTVVGAETGEKKSGWFLPVALGFVVGLVTGAWGRND